MDPKVLIVIITKDFVEFECMQAVINQSYANYSWMISGMKPTFTTGKYVERLYKNCSQNREFARKMALASDADYFLFVDSDIVIPPGAVEEFVIQVEASKKSPIHVSMPFPTMPLSNE